VVTCKFDPESNDFEDKVYDVDNWTDDETWARDEADFLSRQEIFEGGVIDSWTGDWLVEPDWSEEVDITVEGFARYDLRPPEQPAVDRTGAS
jgi:hypothetical protein